MKINHLFLLLTVLIINAAQAQDDAPVSVAKNQFKINPLLSPGFVYEHGFSAKNTLYSELSFAIGYRHDGFYNESTWYFIPRINEQFRHYYNLEKRAAKGKRTANNSGNFVALYAQYDFQSISTNKLFNEYCPSFTLAPVWGIQRTYKGKFNIDLNMGAGVNIDQNDTEFALVANFTLGWVIGK
jgi:opacity protein-like surface antigen